jgi:anti-anti-sigma factor
LWRFKYQSANRAISPSWTFREGPTISDGESDLLRTRLEQLIANGARKFLLNLADLSHVDSSGFSVIVKACASLRDQGGELRFIRPTGRALLAFNVLRLLDLIPTFDNENDRPGQLPPAGLRGSALNCRYSD